MTEDLKNTEELGKMIKPLNTTTSRVSKTQKRFGSGSYQAPQIPLPHSEAETPEVSKKQSMIQNKLNSAKLPGQIVIKQ